MATTTNQQGHQSDVGVFASEVDEMKERITDKLQRRQDERVAKLEEIKTQRESATGKQENADYFRSNFTKEKAAIENRLAAVSNNVDKSALTDLFDELVTDVQKLLKFVTESTLSLTSYQIRKFQDEVYSLYADVEAKRNELIPKKKFAFKGRQKKSDKPKQVDKPKAVVEEVDGPAKIPKDLLKFQCGFVDLSDSDMTLKSDEIQAKDVGLTSLNSCTVKLFGSPNAIHMNNLKNCKVFSGPVPGSIFVDNCQDCTIVVSCQQLRVHHTTATQFYLHVTSRAIIEDTSGVGFAPYNWSYEGQEEDFQTSQLDRSRNSWDDVDDFNWLASDKASPNWSIIPPEKRVASW
ncbi:tubulin-specific chaperone C-like [Patiria miniata]|uniref:C-CAP/cofactor C-like domain-containing protein n=1 Tax=Patiria miniata TaxID=46514 RepID=A0A913Z522_PATMI|nr:tubulin-specific chaperone C-like [Patiria miniata]